MVELTKSQIERLGLDPTRSDFTKKEISHGLRFKPDGTERLRATISTPSPRGPPRGARPTPAVIFGRPGKTPGSFILEQPPEGFFPGGDSFSPDKTFDSIMLGDPTVARKRRTKLKEKKNGKKKNGKTKQKPLKSIFDLSF